MNEFRGSKILCTVCVTTYLLFSVVGGLGSECVWGLYSFPDAPSTKWNNARSAVLQKIV